MKKLRGSNGLRAMLFAAFCGIAALFQPLYVWIDNYIVSWVANGLVGENAECFHISYLYRRFLNLLARLLPRADVFALTERVLVFLALWALAWLALSEIRSKRLRLAALAGLFAVTFLMGLFYVNYTVWTTFFVCVGWICVGGAARGRISWRRWAAGCFFVLAGCCLRIQGVLIALPFAALDLMLRGWFHRQLKRALTALLAILLIVAAAGAEIGLVYARGDLADGYAYNEARMSVVDYPMMDYDEVRGRLDMSENDYEALQNWMLMDTEVVDIAYLRTMASEAHEVSGFREWRNALGLVKRGAFGSVASTIFFVLTAAAAALFFCRSGIEDKLRAAGMAGGAAVIALYFAAQGRLPNRVLYCLALCVLSGVWNGTLYGASERSAVRKTSAAAGAVLAAVCAAAIFCTQIAPPRTALAANVPKHTDDCPTDGLYIWAYHSFKHSPLLVGFGSGGWLPSEEALTYHFTDGNWLYGQPATGDVLAMHGVENPMKALAERDDVFYVGTEEDARRVETWLLEHYGISAPATERGEINGVTVWRFTEECVTE